MRELRFWNQIVFFSEDKYGYKSVYLVGQQSKLKRFNKEFENIPTEGYDMIGGTGLYKTNVYNKLQKESHYGNGMNYYFVRYMYNPNINQYSWDCGKVDDKEDIDIKLKNNKYKDYILINDNYTWRQFKNYINKHM